MRTEYSPRREQHGIWLSPFRRDVSTYWFRCVLCADRDVLGLKSVPMTNLHFAQSNLNGHCNSNTDGWQPSPGLPGPEGRTIVCGHSVALNAAETFKSFPAEFLQKPLSRILSPACLQFHHPGGDLGAMYFSNTITVARKREGLSSREAFLASPRFKLNKQRR